MRSERLFRVKLTGEHAIDQGGPFREILSTFVAELESSLLPLLLPTPNATTATGNHRDCFLLNPRACDAARNARCDLHRRMLVFLGQLMGYSLRNSEFMSLSLAPLIWKRIVGEPLTFADLQAVDESVASSLLVLKQIDVDPDTFENEIFPDLRFEFLSCDGVTNVELEQGGSQRPVTFADRDEFFDKAVTMRLAEFDAAADAVKHGLATTVPQILLSLYAGHQLETLVCGSVEIDVALLKKNTQYELCSEHDVHVRYFWKVLDQMSHEERSVFLRFVWGRSRLPLVSSSDGTFSTKLKINRFVVPTSSRDNDDSDDNGRRAAPTADDYFPVGHTCFFSIDLPAYSSFEVARKKIRYAIHNCRAIDGDTG